MSLLAILVGFALDQLVPQLDVLRRVDLLLAQVTWLVHRGGRVMNGPLGVALVIAGPVLAVEAIDMALRGVSELLAFAFDVVVLSASLGLRALSAQVHAFLEMRERGDEEGGRHAAGWILGREVHSRAARLTREVLGGVLVQGNERGLAVLFWFLVLGPAGALSTVLANALNRLTGVGYGPFGAAAHTVHFALAWVPARLTAVSYALAGSLVHAMTNWRNNVEHWGDSNVGTLVSSGTGALLVEYESGSDPLAGGDIPRQDQAVRAALGLVWRAVAVWVTVMALFTLGGWAA